MYIMQMLTKGDCTFTNGLDKYRIVTGYDKAKTAIVTMNNNDARIRVGGRGCRHQVAVVDGS